MEEKTFKIYELTDATNGMKYIGQTILQPRQRLRGHIYSSTEGTSNPLSVAIREHGAAAFSIKVLSSCTTQERADELERYWISKFNTMVPNGYNRRPGGRKRELARTARIQLPVRVLPSVAHELRDRAKERFGDATKAGRLIEEYVIKYRPTPEQAEEPVLRTAWQRGLSTSDTIQLIFEELTKLRERLHHYEARVPCQEGA